MGCDIHLYIEYRSKNNKTNNWNSFGERINPGRNYVLFALMADVRNYTEKKITVLVEPRGMPDDAGHISKRDNLLYITDTQGDGCVTVETAKKWVESGSSTYVNSIHNDKPTWVTHPDWHTHSWLNVSEYQSILGTYLELEKKWHVERVEEHAALVKSKNIQPNSWMYDPPKANIEPEYQAVLASLSKFEELGFESRIVFWFDN